MKTCGVYIHKFQTEILLFVGVLKRLSQKLLCVYPTGMLERVSFLEASFIFGTMTKKEEPAFLLLECTENCTFKKMEPVRKRIIFLT